MAINVSTDISSALSTIFAPKIVRQYNQVARTARLFPAIPCRTGKAINWDVENTGAIATSYSEGSDVPASEFQTNSVIPATLNFGFYRSSFMISDFAIAIAQQSRESATALMDLLGERIENATTILASTINQGMILGTGTDGSGNPTYTGFLGGALASTGTYAGINRSTYPLFAGNTINALNGNLSVDLLDQLEQKIFVASNQTPTKIVMDPIVWRKYKGIFSPLQRIVQNGSLPNVGNIGPDLSDNEPVLYWNNIPIFRDKDLTAGTVMMLNQNHISHEYIVSSPIGDEEGITPAYDTNGDELDGIDMPFKIKRLAESGDYKKYMIYCYVQLAVKRPNTCGTITSVNVS